MSNAITAYIGLGSNLGDRRAFIKKAREALESTDGITGVSLSDITESPPLANMQQSRYLNAVAEIQTNLPPETLLKTLHQIENSLDRRRQEKWAPRTIDLDIILYGSQIIDSPTLKVPHPQMHLRSFVLKGLVQLKADIVHPVLSEPVSVLLDRLCGQDFALDSVKPQLVCIAGLIGVGKTTLANKLAKHFSVEAVFEAYDTNPFLPELYAGKHELALDCQLYFLASRAEQLDRQLLKAGQRIFCDYVFDKEMIYATALLDDRQLALYERLYRQIQDRPVRPVLTIYLTDTPQNCMRRIQKRNRPYEQNIETEFLDTLAAAYDELFRNWRKSPVIELPMERFDCYNDAELNHLAKQVALYTVGKTPKDEK